MCINICHNCRGCNVRTGPTPGFQPLGELRDRPGKPKGKYNSKSALLFKGFNVHSDWRIPTDAPRLHAQYAATRHYQYQLGVCWNSVIRRLFNYHKWESVKGVLHGLGRLNVAHLIMLRKVKFYRHMYFSPNIVVRSLFHTALLHSCNNDFLLKSVFLHREAAMDLVYGLFDRCFSWF